MKSLMDISTFNKEEYHYPSYKNAGWVEVEIYHVYPLNFHNSYRYEMEIIDYSGDCALLIHEGEGFEYWISQHLDIELPGKYHISDITGIYYKGEWGYTDDDVKYDFGLVTRIE